MGMRILELMSSSSAEAMPFGRSYVLVQSIRVAASRQQVNPKKSAQLARTPWLVGKTREGARAEGEDPEKMDYDRAHRCCTIQYVCMCEE